MGKGDKRSKKGKIFRGTFGKRRPGKMLKAAAKKNAARAAAAKKAR
jgi:30S ribosomal protein S31